MKKLSFILFTVLLCGASCGYSYAQNILDEGFENSIGTTLPSGWSKEYVNSSVDWIIAGYGAHSGSNVATFKDFSGIGKTKLVTPSMDISGASNPILKFWHTQELSFGKFHKLRIYYKTSAGGSWTLLQEYLESVPSYALRQLDLPNPSADYYIAFEAEGAGEGNIQLDDVVVMSALSAPVIGENVTELTFGDVYNNLPFGKYTATYTIRNTGTQDLIVDSIGRALTNSGITVSGLPVTVAPSEQQNITVELNADELPAGFFNGNLVLKSNDPANPAFTIGVKATVKVALINSYTYETFESGDMPSDWSCINSFGNCRFATYITGGGGGIDNSICIAVNLSTPADPGGAKETLKTGYIAMGANPVFSFNYKALMRSNFEYTAVVAVNEFVLTAQISKDNGKTWESIALTPNVHASTVNYTLVTGDVSTYANELCMIRITVQTIGNPADVVRAHLDNITIGTKPVNDLAALPLTGSATPVAGIAENYTVQVKNLGSATALSYTVNLMKKGETLPVASKAGVSIAHDETKDFVFEWMPGAEGAATLYGEVVFAEDEFLTNNRTSDFSVTVQPGNSKNIKVGTGTEKFYYLPYNTYYMQSLTQSLYFPHELQTNGGEIRSLTYQAEIVQGVINLENIPIQIWMGETDRENLEDGFVDPSTLTLVYDGVRDFPVGKYDVSVILDSPYKYKGGNLVVYSFKKKVADGGYGNINDGFTSTVYEGSSRSISNYLIDDGVFDPENPDSLEITMTYDFIPNTNFVFNFDSAGSLKGLVDNGTAALNEAKIRIIGTGLYALTDASGKYELPYLMPGNYRIEVSKHGYFPDTSEVVITDGLSKTLDVTLLAIPTYTVRGKVTGSNAPNGLANVSVSLSGYEQYTATTNASGDYTIPGVYQNNTYSIEAKKPLYGVYSSSVTVLTADTSHNLMLTEIAYPVFSAAAVKSGNDVVVSWEAPVAATDTAYILDDGTDESGEGVKGGFNVWLGNQYITNDAGVLKSIDLYGRGQAGASEKTVTVEIFNSSRVLVGSSEPFRIPENVWINIPLANIPYSGTFYVMVRWRDTEGSTNFIGTDGNGPNYRENLSMVHDGTNWATFSGQVGKRCVFLIRPNGVIIDESVTPAPSEYTVYRLKKGEEEQPADWTELTATTGKSYIDTDWKTVTEGMTCRYAVTATYTGENNISKPVLTASIIEGGTGIFDVESKEALAVYP
ncbi:MAG: carboxypeptidase regulatory-like domain-containing protein, partial [Bacteroidales bacterium]|nr:carboxypeptidase regulatory-like domain-containing protein [Bacteroidales bacterium]